LAQALPNQVLALYPQRTGELVFVDLVTLRNSPHYAQIKAQLLPERFRQLEQWIRVLGMDFEREVRRLSWAFVPPAQGSDISFIGVAEGTFALDEVEQRAQQQKLNVARRGGSLVISLGRNDRGDEFVFAFLDPSTALFGLQEVAEEIVDRRAQGGSSVLNNTAFNQQLRQLNGQAPLWLAMDQRFTGLALKQMLPEASQVAGFDAIAGRMQHSSMRFQLRQGLQGTVTIQCRDSADALAFSSAAQAAFAFQALRLQDTDPELSRVLSQVQLNRQDEQLTIQLDLAEPDLVAMLQKNAFTLEF
jgi:hypothetical protein